MLIIIEGVDETGKTTLAKSLVQHHNQYAHASYYHSGPPGEMGPLYEYTKALLNENTEDLLVVDRFHWGELVYGPEYRGVSGIDAVQRYWLDLAVGGLGGQMILAIDSPAAIYNRVVRNGDDFVLHDRDHLRSLQDKFIAITRESPLPVWAYSIDRTLDNRRVLSATAGSWSDVWGAYYASRGHLLSTPAPKVLLVGDEPGMDGDEVERSLPFYPVKPKCGYYLMNALLRSGLYRRVMITNSQDPAGSPTQISKILANTPKIERVVALGRVASSRLTDQGIEHGVVVHPQYARRFHHHNVEGYATALFVAAQYGVDTIDGGYL